MRNIEQLFQAWTVLYQEYEALDEHGDWLTPLINQIEWQIMEQEPKSLIDYKAHSMILLSWVHDGEPTGTDFRDRLDEFYQSRFMAVIHEKKNRVQAA